MCYQRGLCYGQRAAGCEVGGDGGCSDGCVRLQDCGRECGRRGFKLSKIFFQKLFLENKIRFKKLSHIVEKSFW